MTCKECGRRTAEESQDRAVAYRDKPIFGTDLKRSPVEIIREVRQRLLHARNALDDFHFGWPGFKERTQPVEGLLTCGVCTLYNVIQDLEKIECGVAVDHAQG